MNRINIISVVVSVIFLIFVIYQVRKKRLSEAYSLLWIFAGIVFILISAFPFLLNFLSELIGVYYPPATLFLALIVSIILISFQFSILLTIRSNQTRKLSQEVALLKNRLEKLESTGSSD